MPLHRCLFAPWLTFAPAGLDALLLVGKTSALPAVQAELAVFGRSMRERFTSLAPAVSDMLFRLLDLDDNGIITRKEFDIFLSLLTGGPTTMDAGFDDLARSYASEYLSHVSQDAEREVL